MAQIKIDGREYDTEKLSAAARQQISNVRLVDREIRRLKQQIAIAETARRAYAAALQGALPKDQ